MYCRKTFLSSYSIVTGLKNVVSRVIASCSSTFKTHSHWPASVGWPKIMFYFVYNRKGGGVPHVRSIWSLGGGTGLRYGWDSVVLISKLQPGLDLDLSHSHRSKPLPGLDLDLGHSHRCKLQPGLDSYLNHGQRSKPHPGLNLDLNHGHWSKPQPGIDLDLSCGHRSKPWPGLDLDLSYGHRSKLQPGLDLNLSCGQV